MPGWRFSQELRCPIAPRWVRAAKAKAAKWRLTMLDAIMLAIGGGFFVAAILYTIACDKI